MNGVKNTFTYTMTKQERRKKYNKNYREKHPEITKKNSAYIKARYRKDDAFREDVKRLQKKNYWKRQGYDYESYTITSDWANGELIEHLKDYIGEAEEIKLTRIKNGWILEIKTIINE